MECKHCGSEISNDSVFCEHCGVKVKKLINVKLWIIGSLVVVGFVVGALAIVNESRWKEINNNRVEHWPACKGGNGTYYILQKEGKQRLARVEGDFPIRIKLIDDVVGKVYACKGEREKDYVSGTFALLSNDGEISFVNVYSGQSGEIHFCDQVNGVYRSDESHIYGMTEAYVCGSVGQNVEMIFSNGWQPVKRSDGKWNYINTGGDAHEDGFDDAYPFCYGIARVCKNGRWFYLDQNWKELRIHNDYDDGVTYTVLQGKDFRFDDNKEKMVAEMLLRSSNVKVKERGYEYYWALVDNTGKILESNYAGWTREKKGKLLKYSK